MSMVDALIKSLAPTLPPVIHSHGSIRSFTAAQISPLTNSWTTNTADINTDLSKQLNILRARSRDTAKNNDYGRKFLSMVKTNVVGSTGITLQVKAKKSDGTVDQFDSSVLEAAFSDWGKKTNCDVTGRLSWRGVQSLAIETVAKDGECLIRKRRRGKYAFQLQFIDTTKLDAGYNVDNKGQRIRMGVELDAYNAPVAYHLLTTDTSSGYVVAGRRYERVPASDMYHIFLSENVDQIRGFPWMSTAMLRLNMLNGYEDAALVAARNAASRLGFFTSIDGSPPPLVDTEIDGDKYTTAMPGTYDTLPAGYDFKPFSSEYPHQNYGDFVKASLRGIAAGLCVAYHNLANDLEGVNFSSSRAGILEEREVWKSLQEWIIEELCAPIYSDWLKNALDLTNALSPLPANKLFKFDAATWQARRWTWVDPTKDINANIDAINAGLKSRGDVIREQGRDPEDVWQEIERENERLKTVLTATGNQNANTAQNS
jgi:lambda family phage portal protein